jgi:cytochrome d ubiquinol oxidase subunit II
VADRARRYGSVAALTTIVLYAVAGVVMWLWIDGYKVDGALPAGGPSNPLLKAVVVGHGEWFTNFDAHHALWAAPALGFVGAALAWLCLRMRREMAALLASAVGIAGIIVSVGAAMFPFILPSSIEPRASLTVWDSSSSHLTLFIMLVVTVVFIPLIVAYSGWVYRVMRGKVDAGAIRDGRGHAY